MSIACFSPRISGTPLFVKFDQSSKTNIGTGTQFFRKVSETPVNRQT
ncbi:hypothetical protein GGD52_003671 [Agrobacterium tumefaciens]|nr:hypothetical protein [Agrobacterium radiobacter]MBB5589050.1 hypothetical protein [Agrobacterium radiobacter]